MPPVSFSRFQRYFVAVARLGSIRKASEQLNVSASAIDRQILRAERDLGVTLFERLPSGLRVTAAGEMLLDAGQRWQREFDQVASRMDDLKGLRRGNVRIAVIDALAQAVLPAILREIRAELPGITFEISVLENHLVMQGVASGEVDLGLALDPRSARGLQVRAHAEIPLGFVTRAGHELTAHDAVRFSRCAEYPMIAPAEPLALCDQVNALEASSGVSPQIVVRSDNIQLMKSLVREELGIAILAWIDVVDEVEGGELGFVRLSDPILRPLALGLCIDPARQLSAAARTVVDRIEGRLARLGPGTGTGAI
ncbi:LysR family transcriptional regulator [Sphingomonas sp.]|uniref:LysR family transcriptional regulator n=1 Tax=Sphingomonas sp. TaxID=28214 RepID=UPI000DB04913|nr:LysR family transcriptional regulator [Sphingomonas sp.]PZU07234.1 MAG: LysR family transcriptional regulator [Sphingomonas sp.]